MDGPDPVISTPGPSTDRGGLPRRQFNLDRDTNITTAAGTCDKTTDPGAIGAVHGTVSSGSCGKPTNSVRRILELYLRFQSCDDTTSRFLSNARAATGSSLWHPPKLRRRQSLLQISSGRGINPTPDPTAH